MIKTKKRAFISLGFAAVACLLIAAVAFSARVTSVRADEAEETPTQITWAKMSAGEASYDDTTGTMTLVSETFGITPMVYSCRGEGAYADSPYVDYNDTKFKFDFRVNPKTPNYDEFEIDDPDAGEWYLTFSFRNPELGALGQEWEAAYASFFILRDNATVFRISSGSSARKDALEIKLPRRVKGAGGKWITDETCVDFLDNQKHSVEIEILDNERRIVCKVDGEVIFDCNLDTYDGGKYSAFEIEPQGGYMFQGMNCEATVSSIEFTGNDIEKNIVTPTGVTINRTVLEMKVGDTEYLRAKMEPAGAESKIIWESSDPTAATVNETGMVTALKATDEVQIIAKIQGYDDIKAVCKVKITGGTSGGSGKKSGCGSVAAGVSALAGMIMLLSVASIAVIRKKTCKQK